MQMLNEMQPEMTSLDATLLQRRLLVLGSSLIILWFWTEGFVALWFGISVPPSGYGADILFVLVALTSFICQYRLYHMNATRIVSVSDKDMDERQ